MKEISRGILKDALATRDAETIFDTLWNGGAFGRVDDLEGAGDEVMQSAARNYLRRWYNRFHEEVGFYVNTDQIVDYLRRKSEAQAAKE